jgi:hypothetical protein
LGEPPPVAADPGAVPMVGFGRECADWGIEAMVVFGAAALVLLVAATISDLRFRLIPDWVGFGWSVG